MIKSCGDLSSSKSWTPSKRSARKSIAPRGSSTRGRIAVYSNPSSQGYASMQVCRRVSPAPASRSRLYSSTARRASASRSAARCPRTSPVSRRPAGAGSAPSRRGSPGRCAQPGADRLETDCGCPRRHQSKRTRGTHRFHKGELGRPLDAVADGSIHPQVTCATEATRQGGGRSQASAMMEAFPPPPTRRELDSPNAPSACTRPPALPLRARCGWRNY